MCVKLLLEAGADVNGSPETLIVSAGRGNDGCLKLLLEAGADVNVCSDSDTALHYAAKHGHVSCIGLLFRAGAYINPLNTDHRNPLMLAAINNRLESVKLLFKAGAEVGITNNRGFSTLQSYVLTHEHRGRSEVDTEMVRLLHAAGERKEEISEGIIRRLKAQTDIQRMLSASSDNPLESSIDQRLQHLSDIALQYLTGRPRHCV